MKRTHVVPHVFETKGGLAGKHFVMPHVFEQKGRMMIVAGGPALHLHTDDLGNTLALTDDSGAVVERYDYDDYGWPSFLNPDGVPTLETSSGVGNPILFRGMEWDSETGLYLASKRFGIGTTAPEAPLGTFFDPQTGRATRGKVKTVKDMGGSATAFAGNNPWTGGSPSAMKKGTVKFFNETKGFGRVTGEASSLIVPVAMDKGLRFRGSAAKVSHNILKSYFETGDIPTQDQFGTLLDRSAKHTKTGHVTLLK